MARAKHCQLVGGGKGVILGDTATFPGIMMSPRLLSSPSHPSQQSTITPTGQSPRVANGVKAEIRGKPGQQHRSTMEHKMCKIIAGPYKGHTGIIKDVTNTTVRVELYSSVQTINVEKARVQLIDNEGRGSGKPLSSMSSYAPHKTPVATNDGSKTPLYSDSRTDIGTRTPMYESGKTPNPYEAARTPVYTGAMTPRADGGASAWDPNVTNTPAPDLNEDFGPPSVGPRTPGAMSLGHSNYEASPAPSPLGISGGGMPTTPGSGYPHTPGSVNNYQAPYSPAPNNNFDQAPSPMPTGSFQAPSPMLGGSQVAHSPLGSGSYHASPHIPSGMAPSPMGLTASSPSHHMSANSPFSAYSPSSHGNTSASYNSPGSGIPGSAGSTHNLINSDLSDWYTTDIMVVIQNNCDDESIRNKQGVIRSIIGTNLCNVFIPDMQKTSSVAGNYLQPMHPKKDDSVKVMLGEDKESIGTLISIDGYDGIVRMDQDKQLKILNLRFLGKMAPKELQKDN